MTPAQHLPRPHQVDPPCGTGVIFTTTPATKRYTLSLHDALPICGVEKTSARTATRHSTSVRGRVCFLSRITGLIRLGRSEEHTSELQSPCNIVCRRLLGKKQRNMRSNK